MIAISNVEVPLLKDVKSSAFENNGQPIAKRLNGASTDQTPVLYLPKMEITGVSVTAVPFKAQIEKMVEWAVRRSSRTVCVANVHMLMTSQRDPVLRKALAQADLVTPDGMPLVWMLRALGIKGQDRVAGMDIFLAVCQEAVKHNIALFLLGSTPDVLDKMQARLHQEFPSLKLAGTASPPFRPLTEAEDTALIAQINNSHAGFTFVALGCPKQECWMAAHHGRIQSVMVGVGGVFPVYAGIQKHAPKWIRENGLEWLYRLVQEPRRLFGRYFKTMPPFIWLAYRQLCHHRQQST